MKTIIRSFVLINIILILISCGEDTTPPDLENFHIGFNESEKMFQGQIGLISFIASDDKNLVSYDVSIQKSGSKSLNETLSDWNYSESWDITQTEYVVYNYDISVPEDADTGLYNLNLKLFDEAGNIKEDNFDFNIVSYPGNNFTFNFTDIPDDGAEYLLNEYIYLAGNITCLMENLKNVLIVLRKDSEYIPIEEINENNSIVIGNILSFSDPSNLSFSKNIKVGTLKDLNSPANPIDWESGIYNIYVLARDAFNTLEYPIPVNINIEIE